MRRTTEGVLGWDAMVDAERRRVDSLAPEAVIRALEPHVSDARKERMLSVIHRRIGSVRVLLDEPYDPHNGAAIVRTSEVLGLCAVHVAQRGSAPFILAGSVARSAQKWLNLHCHSSATDAVRTLTSAGYSLIAAVPDGELTPEALRDVPRAALVLGNERTGVSSELLSACSATVRVPMRGFVESLNVSVSAAILLYEATRGREGNLPHEEVRRLYARGLYFSSTQAVPILRASGILAGA